MTRNTSISVMESLRKLVNNRYKPALISCGILVCVPHSFNIQSWYDQLPSYKRSKWSLKFGGNIENNILDDCETLCDSGINVLYCGNLSWVDKNPDVIVINENTMSLPEEIAYRNAISSGKIRMILKTLADIPT